jgi:hypothetical protein
VKQRRVWGFTTVEIMVASSLLALVVIPVFTVLMQISRMDRNIQLMCDLQARAGLVLEEISQEINKGRGLCQIQPDGTGPLAGILRSDRRVMVYTINKKADLVGTLYDVDGNPVSAPRLLSHGVDSFTMYPQAQCVRIVIAVSGEVAKRRTGFMLSTVAVARGW